MSPHPSVASPSSSWLLSEEVAGFPNIDQGFVFIERFADLYLGIVTSEERERLEAIKSYGRHSAQKITRARILVKADQGESDSAIAEALNCHRSTVWRTGKKVHERGRLETIKRKDPDRTYETKFDSRDEAYLI